MNINLVEIDANKTVGKNPVLVDVAPSYVYENGKRTGEVSGFKYTVALPEKAFEKLTVKIDGECKLDKPNDKNYPVVIFDGLEMRPIVLVQSRPLSVPYPHPPVGMMSGNTPLGWCWWGGS